MLIYLCDSDENDILIAMSPLQVLFTRISVIMMFTVIMHMHVASNSGTETQTPCEARESGL